MSVSELQRDSSGHLGEVFRRLDLAAARTHGDRQVFGRTALGYLVSVRRPEAPGCFDDYRMQLVTPEGTAISTAPQYMQTEVDTGTMVHAPRARLFFPDDLEVSGLNRGAHVVLTHQAYLLDRGGDTRVEPIVALDDEERP